MIHVDLGPDVRAVFTDAVGDPVAIGTPGNLSHRRPHRPDDLERSRHQSAVAVGGGVPDLVFMRQVHGTRVAEVGRRDRGHEVGPCDAMTTTDDDVVLAVLTADCVPVLLRSGDRIGVAHAGRVGLTDGVLDRVADAFDTPGRAVVGPAIGGCCYEVPADLRDRVACLHPEAAATTTWGTPSLDLPAAARARLQDAGWDVTNVAVCTLHDDGQHSHRRSPDAGRQGGLIRRVAA